MSNVLNLATAEEFDTVVRNSALFVCHFYADWVDQCRHMEKILNEMSSLPEYHGVRFGKLAAEDVPEISHRYNVSAVPTFVIIRRTKEVGRVEGANPGILVNKIKQNINYIKIDRFPDPEQDFREPPADDINFKLKKLVNQAPVMLFMKGTASTPKCGFSKQMVELLNSKSVNFQTFDILNDAEVREGLKKFSEWPTYPQLYVNGQLIGGLDVVKELDSSGELKNILPTEACIEDRLKFLIKKSPIMVFMKGSKQNPKCGFSKQLIQLFDSKNLDYETFDILKDEAVREGLKTFSKWPTYPQVYVNGELIGGLDVIKELDAQKQLMAALDVK